MPRWGANSDQDFKVGFAGPELTANFADNARVAKLSGASVSSKFDQALLYVDYTKGNEDGIEVLVSYSTNEDAPPAERFFDEMIRDDSTGIIEDHVYRFVATKAGRIPLLIGKSEDKMSVAVRGFGAAAPPYTGTVELLYGMG